MSTSLLDDISKGANWILSTFSGRDTARFQRDIPGVLAKWLFRIGTIGAVIQIPITFFVLLYTIAFLIGGLIYGKPYGVSKEMLICPYLLAGYAVWVGWGWRSRKPRNMKICVLFWLASAGFYLMLPVHIWMDSESTGDFFGDLWNPFLLWYIGVTSVSLIALLLEFFIPRYDVQAA